MSRYAIWNKQDNLITPIGEVLSAEQWIERYPMCGLAGIKTIIGGSAINGSVCMEFTSTVETYEKLGVDFSECKSDQDYLDAIETFEDSQNATPAGPTVQERTAEALEVLALASMPDVEE